MNVIFHISVGAAIVASMSHLEMNKHKTVKVTSGFIIGIISHGVLDYAPHCYPINSVLDFILGLLVILLIFFSVKNEFKVLVSAVLFGCVFPDILDLLPEIANSKLGLNFPIFENIFPWHLHEYSGSIYTENCNVSNINHIFTLVFSGIVILLNKKGVMKVLK